MSERKVIFDKLTEKNWELTKIVSLDAKYGYMGEIRIQKPLKENRQSILFKVQYSHIGGAIHASETILLGLKAQRELLRYLNKNLEAFA
jgi:hypothetical protein